MRMVTIERIPNTLLWPSNIQLFIRITKESSNIGAYKSCMSFNIEFHACPNIEFHACPHIGFPICLNIGCYACSNVEVHESTIFIFNKFHLWCFPFNWPMNEIPLKAWLSIIGNATFKWSHCAALSPVHTAPYLINTTDVQWKSYQCRQYIFLTNLCDLL